MMERGESNFLEVFGICVCWQTWAGVERKDYEKHRSGALEMRNLYSFSARLDISSLGFVVFSGPVGNVGSVTEQVMTTTIVNLCL